MILVQQNDNVYEIRFPYNPVLVSMVKNVPGRKWHPEEKFWSVPLDRLGFLIAQFKGTPYEQELKIESNEDLNVNATLDEIKDTPDTDISDITLYAQGGQHLFQHQIDMLKFAKWRMENGLNSGFILADSPGAGKTLQVMNWAMYLKEKHNCKHCLIIVCVNSAKYNWREDIIKHTNGAETPYILGTRPKRDGSLNLTTGSKEKLQDLTTLKMYGKEDGEDLPYFLILNIEAIRMREKKKYPIADKIIELINSGEISIIALDEVHRNCFEYNTLIRTNQGLIPIGDIVKHRLKVNVLSCDLDSNSFVYKPVVDWHEFSADSQLVELSIQDRQQIKTIKCTPDHKFYTTNRGWVAASDLTESDDIVVNEEVSNDN